MALLARLNDFQPATTIVSADVDAEFNQLVNILNGTSTTKDALIKYNNATDPVLRVDQVGAGVIQQWLVNGTEKVSIRNNGSLRINSAQAIVDPVKLAVNCDSNNNASVTAVIQQANAADVGVRIAMEAATAGGITAFQVTKFSGGVVPLMLVRASGETRVSPGYPTNLSDNPGLTVGAAVTLGGQYKQTVTTVGNVGAGQDVLHTYTVAAYVFANDGDTIDLIGSGRILAAGGNKELRIRIGGTDIYSTAPFDPASNLDFHFRATFMRIDSDSVIAMVIWGDNLGTLPTGTNTQVNGLDFTSTIVIDVTGQDTDGTNDRITMNASALRKYARAQ